MKKKSHSVNFLKKIIICICRAYFQTEWHEELLQTALKVYYTTPESEATINQY